MPLHRQIGLYVEQRNRLLNRTLTRSRLTVEAVDPQGTRAALRRTQARRAIPLELTNGQWLGVGERVAVAQGRVEVSYYSYSYIVSTDPYDEQGWVFRYEYDGHPAPGYPYANAHVHVNIQAAAAGVADEAPFWSALRAYQRRKQVKKMHLPTGPIRLEQILHHLIVDWGVPTVVPMEQALALLRESPA